MRNKLNKIRRNERGVAATEYMLIIAVVVLAVIMIGKRIFVDQYFKQGVTAAGQHVEAMMNCNPLESENGCQ